MLTTRDTAEDNALEHQSAISPEFIALHDRVIAARAGFRTSGLSRRGANALIALGCWTPEALKGVPWSDGDNGPGLCSRLANTRDCGTITRLQVELFHGWQQ